MSKRIDQRLTNQLNKQLGHNYFRLLLHINSHPRGPFYIDLHVHKRTYEENVDEHLFTRTVTRLAYHSRHAEIMTDLIPIALLMKDQWMPPAAVAFSSSAGRFSPQQWSNQLVEKYKQSLAFVNIKQWSNPMWNKKVNGK